MCALIDSGVHVLVTYDKLQAQLKQLLEAREAQLSTMSKALKQASEQTASPPPTPQQVCRTTGLRDVEGNTKWRCAGMNRPQRLRNCGLTTRI